jgi:thymidylate synthase (FAD)
MNIKLIDRTGLRAAAVAAKTCIGKAESGWDMPAGEIAPFLKRAILLTGHESVLEHVVYVFEVQGLSRACLQQLARHRHISLSVKSTRWALEKHGDYYTPPAFGDDFIGKEDFKADAESAIRNAREMMRSYGNDVAKYLLPECITTDLILTVNLRELRHVYRLRTGRTAMLEFQHLAKALVACLPEDEQELVRYRSDALERAVIEYLETGTDEARARMEALVE